MTSTAEILADVKKAVLARYPEATLILYGSYARGEQREDSDLDILVLIDKEKIEYEDRKKIVNAIFPIQLNADLVISPTIYPKNLWGAGYRQHTAFYVNVSKDGVLL